MDCAKAHDMMNAYIDDALSAASRRELERHLQDCPDCSAELRALQSLSAALRNLPEQELPLGFEERLHEALSAAPAPPKPGLWQRGWVKGLAAAACLVLVLGVVSIGGDLLLNTLNRNTETTPVDDLMVAPEMAQMFGGATMDSGSGGRAYDQPAAIDMAEYDIAYEAEMGEMQVADDGAFVEPQNGGPANAAMPDALAKDAAMERKIIKNASVSLRVDDFTVAYDALAELAVQYGGYVEYSDAYIFDEEGGLKSGYVTLRVDAAQLEAVLASIAELGKVEGESTNSQDVSLQYYDLQARLTQYETQRDRLMALMDQATAVEELVALESELGRVQAELESLTQQLNYLSQQISLSTVNVDLYEPAANTQSVQLSGWAGLWQRIKEGFISGINGLLHGISGLIVFFFRILPLLIVLLIIVLVLVLIFRTRRKKQ